MRCAGSCRPAMPHRAARSNRHDPHGTGRASRVSVRVSGMGESAIALGEPPWRSSLLRGWTPGTLDRRPEPKPHGCPGSILKAGRTACPGHRLQGRGDRLGTPPRPSCPRTPQTERLSPYRCEVHPDRTATRRAPRRPPAIRRFDVDGTLARSGPPGPRRLCMSARENLYCGVPAAAGYGDKRGMK